MYKVVITETAGGKEILLSEGDLPSGKILKVEEFSDLLAAKKRYHMLRTYDEAMLERTVSSSPENDALPGVVLDTILGREPARSGEKEQGLKVRRKNN